MLVPSGMAAGSARPSLAACRAARRRGLRPCSRRRSELMPPSPRRSRSGCDPLARIYHVAGRARFPLWESMIIEAPLRYPITGIAPCSARAAEQRDEMPAPHLITSPQNTFSISAIRRKDDAEQHTLVHTFLFGSTDMSTAIRRDDIIDLVTRNRHPSAVYLHFGSAYN